MIPKDKRPYNERNTINAPLLDYQTSKKPESIVKKLNGLSDEALAKLDLSVMASGAVLLVLIATRTTEKPERIFFDLFALTWVGCFMWKLLGFLKPK